jgi:hypothetical protein
MEDIEGWRMRKHIVFLVSCLLFAFTSCSKSEAPQLGNATAQAGVSQQSSSSQPGRQATASNSESAKSNLDACTLLSSKEIQSVQGEPSKETKPSERSQGGFAIAQCYFELPTRTNSISLMVTQRGESAGARNPKDFWKETFHRDEEFDKEAKARGRAEDEEAAPERVAGVGEDAYWTGNRVGGALYALKGNTYIRISVGGGGDQASKIRKSRALAQIVLKRL